MSTGFGNAGGFGAPQGMEAFPQAPSTALTPDKAKKPGTRVTTRALDVSGEVTGQQNRFAYGMPFPVQSRCGVVRHLSQDAHASNDRARSHAECRACHRC
jgi:hypothetical protein